MEPIKYSIELFNKSLEKKLYNIKSFSELDRSGLGFRTLERRLLMREFNTGEKLYIQFPGKETVRERNSRPWDFRPKLILPNEEMHKDLSFQDVWGDLYEMKDSGVDMELVATTFFRMAYMMDSKLVSRMLHYEDIDAFGEVVNSGEIEFSWYEYEPEEEMLERLGISAKDLRGCNIFPYLAYNDYLAQNEDCKYYYQAKYETGKEWDGKVGRNNNLLTHMSVVAFIEGYYNFTKIMAALQRGVAPLPQKYWEQVTGGLVVK